MIRRLTLVALPVVLLAAVAAALTHDPATSGPAQARLEVTGRAVVRASDGAARVVTGDDVVSFGDTVIVEDGTAVVTLAGGERYELRRRGDARSALVLDGRPRLLAGDALVGGDQPATIRIGAVTVRARGPLKADAEGAVAAAYAGGATVAGVGDVIELPALRRLVLVAGAGPEPVRFDGTDPWDRRHLGEAIAFGEQLEALARGYTRDLPLGAGRTEGFFRTVLPALAEEREFRADLLDPARPPGETLVGAAIVVQGRRGAFRERWDQVFSFRSAGAAWGVVALDQGVSSAPVLETIELAIASPAPRRRPASPVDLVPVAPPASAPPAESPQPAPTPTAPLPAAPPVPAPPPEPAPGLLSPVLEPVSNLVDGLLGTLLGGA